MSRGSCVFHYIIYLFLFQCNNPLTKEPKLSAAVRIVSEWSDYDNEVKTLWDSVHKKSAVINDTDSKTKSSKGKFLLLCCLLVEK